MHKFFVGMMIVAVASISGCGSADPSSNQSAGSSPSGDARPSDPIAKVAYDFFDAVLASDRDAARAQLTPLAVQRMAALGMDFLLPVSESSKFTVGEAVQIEEGMAAVDTILTEPDASGKLLQEEITVVLKLQSGKWGVMGVVTGMGPNEQIDGFNFEMPDQPFSPASFEPESTINIAEGGQPTNSVPQQATLPNAQDPFRQ